jgi:hypothetical protein
MRCIQGFRLPSLLLALFICPCLISAQEDSEKEQPSVVMGSLAELRNSRRVLLLVNRSAVVDSRGLARTILNEAYRADAPARIRYPRLYNLLARKLNDYIRRYQSITAVKDIAEADFIVLFNLVEYRRPLGYPYPYGELFIIHNNRASGKPPHIVWKTGNSPIWAEDAIKDFIKDLKAVRGEG